MKYNKENWPYQTGEIALVPYDPTQDYIPDDALVYLHRRLVSEGLLETVLCGMGEMRLPDFIQFLGHRPMVLFCEKTTDGSVYPIMGFGWLSNIDGVDGARRAYFGFGFFREYWGRATRDTMWLCLRYWFEFMKVDVLYGVTRHDNMLAKNFSRKFGALHVGCMPGYLFNHKTKNLDAAYMVVVDKILFGPGFKRWEERRKAVELELEAV